MISGRHPLPRYGLLLRPIGLAMMLWGLVLCCRFRIIYVVMGMALMQHLHSNSLKMIYGSYLCLYA